MKKIIFAFILLIISNVVEAKVTHYRIYSVTTKESNKEWSTSKNTNILVTVDNVIKRIHIKSVEEQVIDFIGFSEVYSDSSVQLSSYGTDTYYNKIYIVINIYSKEEIFLSILYNDYIIMYTMREIE